MSARIATENLLKYRMIDALAQALIGFFKCFKRPMRQKISHAIAMCIFALAKKTRRRSIGNIARAFPGKTDSELTALAKRSYKNIVFGVTECFWLDQVEFDIEMDQQTISLLCSGKAVSIATMHMSCYEAIPFALQKITGRSTTLSNIPGFLSSAKKVYTDMGVDCIDKNSGDCFLNLLQAIRNNRVVSLHSDHYDKAVPLSFFGQKTGAPSGAAMLSAYGKTPLLLGYALLKSDGKYLIHFETISEQPVETNVGAINRAMRQVYLRFEEIITDHPQQWYWSYKRWR